MTLALALSSAQNVSVSSTLCYDRISAELRLLCQCQLYCLLHCVLRLLVTMVNISKHHEHVGVSV